MEPQPAVPSQVLAINSAIRAYIETGQAIEPAAFLEFAKNNPRNILLRLAGDTAIKLSERDGTYQRYKQLCQFANRVELKELESVPYSSSASASLGVGGGDRTLRTRGGYSTRLSSHSD